MNKKLGLVFTNALDSIIRGSEDYNVTHVVNQDVDTRVYFHKGSFKKRRVEEVSIKVYLRRVIEED